MHTQSFHRSSMLAPHPRTRSRSTLYLHRQFIHHEHTSTQIQRTDPRMSAVYCSLSRTRFGSAHNLHSRLLLAPHPHIRSRTTQYLHGNGSFCPGGSAVWPQCWLCAVCAVGHVGCCVRGGGYPVGVSISSSHITSTRAHRYSELIRG